MPTADPDAHSALTLLLLGEGVQQASAPFHSLAKALQPDFATCRLADPAACAATGAWLRQVRRHDAVILVHYNPVPPFLERQLALALAAGCAVTRWWVGSDVWKALTEPDVAASARRLDRLVARNIVVAPHLAEELTGLGIDAVVCPSVYDASALAAPLPDVLPRGVLVYLPGERADFYGLSRVDAAIAANPDLTFSIVGDETHRLAHHANVRSLGWVADMQSIWPDIGLLLRLTEHDGLPRMILEALARGRYVIYAWPLSGCWQADSPEAVQAQLDRFRRTDTPNLSGRDSVRALTDHAERRFIQAVALRPGPMARIRGLLGAVDTHRRQTHR